MYDVKRGQLAPRPLAQHARWNALKTQYTMYRPSDEMGRLFRVHDYDSPSRATQHQRSLQTRRTPTDDHNVHDERMRDNSHPAACS
jgi:hypothetical protein